jgi:hypothetical protein
MEGGYSFSETAYSFNFDVIHDADFYPATVRVAALNFQ